MLVFGEKGERGRHRRIFLTQPFCSSLCFCFFQFPEIKATPIHDPPPPKTKSRTAVAPFMEFWSWAWSWLMSQQFLWALYMILFLTHYTLVSTLSWPLSIPPLESWGGRGPFFVFPPTSFGGSKIPHPLPTLSCWLSKLRQYNVWSRFIPAICVFPLLFPFGNTKSGFCLPVALVFQ